MLIELRKIDSSRQIESQIYVTFDIVIQVSFDILVSCAVVRGTLVALRCVRYNTESMGLFYVY